MRKKLIVSALIIALPLLNGCGKTDTAEAQKAVKAVSAIDVSETNFGSRLNYQGTVKSKDSQNYSFLAGGKIEAVYVTQGQQITKGTMLAKLDTTNLQDEVAQNQSQISALEAALDKTVESYNSQINDKISEIKNKEIDIEVQKKSVDALESSLATYKENMDLTERQLIKAAEDEKNAKILYEVGGISQNEYENTVMNTDSEELAYSQSKTAYEDANAKLISAQGSLTTLQNELNTAKNELNTLQKQKQNDINSQQATKNVTMIDKAQAEKSVKDAVLYADADGYVANIYYNSGENVTANTPIINIISKCEVVTIGVSTSDYEKLGTITGILINNSISGNIDSISSYPDENTDTYAVNISFASNDINIGDIVNVDLLMGNDNGVVVPKDSIININGINYVYKINTDNTVSRVAVDIKEIKDNEVFVSNLSNEKIVTSGIQSLNENDIVREVEG